MIIILLLMAHDRQTSRTSWVVMGTVISQAYDAEGAAAPVIAYSLQGEQKSLQGAVWSSPPSFAIGEHVELLIPYDDPDTVIVNAFVERYFLMVLLGCFTVAFGGVVTLFLMFIRQGGVEAGTRPVLAGQCHKTALRAVETGGGGGA
ncbi:MAG: hypothetical protein AB7N91_27650 [Candidatus Tectimicrobiota bacterium]